jgi:hypothetical protein
VRWIAQPQRRGKRPGQSGQGAVEFALVGGLFFFLVFSIVNAGFFLYGRDAVEHAADVGVSMLSEEGSCSAAGGICLLIPSNCPNYEGLAQYGYGVTPSIADQLAICEMNLSGLTSAPLIHVTAIDIYKVLQFDGAPVDTCGSSGTGAGTSPCNAPALCVVGTTCLEDAYSVDGADGSVDNWLDSSRNVSPASADFVRLVVQFNYSLIATSGSISMSTSNVFRLEPQQ